MYASSCVLTANQADLELGDLPEAACVAAAALGASLVVGAGLADQRCRSWDLPLQVFKLVS